MRQAAATTAGELLADVKNLLAGNAFDAEYILCELLNRRRGNLRLDEPLDAATKTAAMKAAERRREGEPLQYIFNRAYFLDLELFVDRRTLIPRPETELLAEYVCRHAPRGGRLLDVGTGSGALAVAAATARRDLRVTGADVSAAALEVAKLNARKYRAAARFVQSDLTGAVRGERFDFVAANLPYVSETEYRQCPAEVRSFEPRIALVADDGGLALIRRLLAEAPGVLAPGGEAALEIGETQGAAVAGLMEENGFVEVKIMPDLTARPRFVVGKRP